MKKTSILLIFAVLLSACSMTMDQLLGLPPTSTATLTSTSTPTDMPTFTPTFPTQTFTVTPTLVGQKTKTSTPNSTPTQLIFTPLSVTLLPTTTPISLVPQVAMPGFLTISVSAQEFYKEGLCLPTSVKFIAQVTDIGNTAFVLLFVRFKSKQSGNTSEWANSIAMQSVGGGTYTHDLISSEMKAVDSFENAWVQYQLVATDLNSKKIGKTDIFSERLTLLECVATPTPTSLSTPTAQVP